MNCLEDNVFITVREAGRILHELRTDQYNVFYLARKLIPYFGA
jgi:hypothetical protein